MGSRERNQPDARALEVSGSWVTWQSEAKRVTARAAKTPKFVRICWGTFLLLGLLAVGSFFFLMVELLDTSEFLQVLLSSNQHVSYSDMRFQKSTCLDCEACSWSHREGFLDHESHELKQWLTIDSVVCLMYSTTAGMSQNLKQKTQWRRKVNHHPLFFFSDKLTWRHFGFSRFCAKGKFLKAGRVVVVLQVRREFFVLNWDVIRSVSLARAATLARRPAIFDTSRERQWWCSLHFHEATSFASPAAFIAS